MEKPPEEKLAAVSVTPSVAPTEVRLWGLVQDTGAVRANNAYKGQPEGKVGMKVVQRWLCEPETPPSPDAKSTDVPRAPS